MNVNLTPSVDNAKVTNVTKSAATSDLASGESGEAKGFLDKLAALLLGSKGEGEAATSESTAEAKPSSKADATSVGSSSTEALLNQDEDIAVITDEADEAKIASSDAKVSKGDIQSKNDAVVDSDGEVPQSLKAFIATDEEHAPTLKNKTTQAMSDGDEILGRLQEAKQTLVKKDGKPLPLDKAEIVATKGQSEVSPTSSSGESTPQVLSQVADKAQKLQQADPIVPDSIPSDVQQPDIVSDKVLLQEGKASVEAVSPKALPKDFIPPQNGQSLVDVNAVEPAVEVPVEVSLSDEELLSAIQSQSQAIEHQSLPDNHPLMQLKNAKDIEALSDSELAALMAQQAPSEVTVQAEAVGHEKITPMAAAAIPWASATAENAALSNLESDVKNGAKPLPHGAVSQPVHQALQSQQTLTAADKALAAQAPMPAPVSTDAAAQAQLQSNATPMQANPMLAAAMVNQAEQPVNQAAFKAVLGAKALAGLGDGKQSTQGSEAHLAQQLASAAGQQGVNGPQGLRSDNVQAQQSGPALNLSRGDMAAEQMAERVQVMLSKNLKNIDIRLDPPELGRMHIRLNMQGDGATVHFTVANQHARDALEQSMPRLREMLNNQGVQLGNTSVQQQNSGQQQGYAAGGNGSSGQTTSGNMLSGDENLDTDVKLDLNVAAKRDGISYYA